jgi:hypothetical protein
VDHWQGTGLDASGDIRHVWPENKGTWVRDFARAIGVPRERTAAVGDSPGDAAMLDAVRIPVFVGLEPPSGTGWLHRPAADIDAVCRELVDLWQLPEPVSAKVERLANLADTGFDALLVESEQAGVRFLRRLADEWASGANRFDRPGEVLCGARVGGELVAVGGLNLDPYTRKAQVGRVRHV